MSTWKIIATAVIAFAAGAAVPTTPVQALWWDSMDCLVHYMDRATTNNQTQALQHYCRRFDQ